MKNAFAILTSIRIWRLLRGTNFYWMVFIGKKEGREGMNVRGEGQKRL